MATDVEESDTDDHEKPGPAKRQRVLVAQPVTSADANNQQSEDPENPVEVVIDEEEDRRAREKLRGWQACQVVKSIVDNIINRVLENYIMSSPSASFEDPWYYLFGGNQMEDTAVTMAIRNHGLVHSLDFTQSPSLLNERVSNVPHNSETTQAPTATTSSEALLLTDSEAASTSGEGDWLDDTYDSDHQQDFLDRAVAEAIKKKGLSTLSVDYG